MENRKYMRNHLLVHSIVNEIYRDVPSSALPAGHTKDLRRYAGAFDGAEIGLKESFCFLTLRTPGTSPVSYMCHTGPKNNAVSEGNFFQCSGWVVNGNSPLLDHYEEILGTSFYTEKEVDAFAEMGKVPTEESLPAPRNIQAVAVDRAAIRAVLYGTMMRWLQGTPQVHIAVPKADMGHYNEYVLGAMKTIWSYFPFQMRAAVGFTSFLLPRRERDFPKFTIIFVPYHMADVNTIRLDGSSPNAYAAMIPNSKTGMPQLDVMLEKLASSEDLNERDKYLREIYADVEESGSSESGEDKQEGKPEIGNFTPINYVRWGRGLELLNSQDSLDKLIEKWAEFSKDKVEDRNKPRGKEKYPEEISRQINKMIDKRLTPEELGKALEQELAGARPTVAALDKTVEKYLPLCQNRAACMAALWSFVRDNLGKTGLGAEKIYEALSSHEESWGKLTDKKTYGELLARYGREAAKACFEKATQQMEETASLAAKRERANASELKAKQDELRELFREEAEGFVDEASLREMDAQLEQKQRGYVGYALKRELEQGRAVRPEGNKAIRAEQQKLARLARLVPPEGEKRDQLLGMIEDRKIELENLLNDSNTVAADLVEQVRGTRDYFEALEQADKYADKLSREDQERLRGALIQKRPRDRKSYLETFKRYYRTDLSLPLLLGRSAFFRKCIEQDLADIYRNPIELMVSRGNATKMLHQIQTLEREAELFGQGNGLRLNLNHEALDTEIAKKLLSLDVEMQEAQGQTDAYKTQVSDTAVRLLRAGVFNPDQICLLMKTLNSAGIKMSPALRAIVSGEAGELSKEEHTACLRQVLQLMIKGGKKRDKALEEIAKAVGKVSATPEAESALRTIAGEGKQKSSGKGLWIALAAVLGVLLIGAVLAIVFNWFGPKEPKGEEEPVATEAPADELAVEQAYAEGESRSDGLLDLSGKGLGGDSLNKILEMYAINDALTESALDDEELLKSLGYRTRLNLSGNAMEDVSALGSLTGLRRLYLANTPTVLPEALSQLTRLELLDLRRAAVTEGQCAAFSGRLPDCMVLCSDNQGEMLILDGVTYRSGEIGLDASGHGEALLRVANEAQVSSLLADLQELHLSGTGLKSLDQLAVFSKLQYLDLSYSDLTDAQLNSLYGLKTLAMLELQGNAALSQEAVQNLEAALPNCKVSASPAEELERPAMVTIAGESYPADQDSLDLSGKNLSEEDLAAIGSMTGLRQLDLSGTGISDLSFLKELGGLKRLVIRDNAVTDLSPLTALPGLETLYADGNPLQNLGAGERQPMAALQVLSISGVSGELDLSALQFMPRLTVLDLGETAENAEAPLNQVFETLTELKILKLRSLSQLTEATRAALEERGCLILAPADKPAPTEEPGLGEISGMPVDTEEKIMQNTVDEQADGGESGEQGAQP